MLTRREHSSAELRRKLLTRGFDAALVETAVRQLAEEGLLSERRFVEEFVHSRVRQGYGPLRIRADLRERGVPDELAAAGLAPMEGEWDELALAQREKRFGREAPASLAERAKQYRYLTNRGFTAEQIRRAVGRG